MALGEQVLKVLVKTSHDAKGFTDASSRLERFGKRVGITGAGLAKFGRAAIKATALVGILATAVGIKAVLSFAKFEQSMTKMVALVGVSREQVEGFEEAFSRIGIMAAKGPQELADAMFTVTSAGFRGAEALAVLEEAAIASAIGMGETVEIARVATGAISAYGIENLAAKEAIEVLTATARAGNFEVSELAGSLSKALTPAKTAGVGFKDVGGAIALLSRTTTDATESVQMAAAMFRAFAIPTKQTQDALANLGLTTDDVRKSMGEQGLVATLKMLEAGLVEQFGVEKMSDELRNIIPDSLGAMGALTILGASTKTLGETFGETADSVDIHRKGLEEVEKTITHQWGQAMSFMQFKLKDLGKFLNKELGPEVIAMKEKIMEWVEDNKPRLEALKIMVLELWHDGFKPLVKTFVDMAPVIMDTSIAISEILIPTFQKLFNWAQEVLHVIKELMEAFNKLWGSFKERGLGGVAGKIGSGIGALKDILTGKEWGVVPEFQTGGVVPGPIGSPQLIVAHGGENITPVSTDPSIGTQNVTLNITVRNDNDLRVLLRKVEEYLGQKSLRQQFGVS